MPYKDIINRHYVKEGLTDTQIARLYNKTRSWCSHLRKSYGIKTRITTGQIGESLAMRELETLYDDVINMNEIDVFSPFDILLNNETRIDVKAANVCDDGYYRFSLSEQATNGNIESETRIRLRNGRTRKVYTWHRWRYLSYLVYATNGT